MMLINNTFIKSVNGVKQTGYKTLYFTDPVDQYSSSDKLQIAHQVGESAAINIIPQFNMFYGSWKVGINQGYITDKTRYNVFTDSYAYYVYARVIETTREPYEESYIDTIKLELLSYSGKARGITVTIKSGETDIVYWDNLRTVNQDYIDSYDWYLIFYDDMTDKYRWPIIITATDTALTRLMVDGNSDRTQNQVAVKTQAYTDVSDFQAGLKFPDSDHMTVPLFKSRVVNMNEIESKIKDNSDRLDLILSERSSLFVSR